MLAQAPETWLQDSTLAAPTHPYLPASFPFAKGKEEPPQKRTILLSPAHGGKAGIGGFSPQRCSSPAAPYIVYLSLSEAER
jgi:hypothetical protein